MFQLHNKFNKIRPGKIHHRKNEEKFQVRGINNQINVAEFKVKAAKIGIYNYQQKLNKITVKFLIVLNLLKST